MHRNICCKMIIKKERKKKKREIEQCNDAHRSNFYTEKNYYKPSISRDKFVRFHQLFFGSFQCIAPDKQILLTNQKRRAARAVPLRAFIVIRLKTLLFRGTSRKMKRKTKKNEIKESKQYYATKMCSYQEERIVTIRSKRKKPQARTKLKNKKRTVTIVTVMITLLCKCSQRTTVKMKKTRR